MARLDLGNIVSHDELASMDAVYRAALLEYIERLNEALCDNLIPLFDDLTGDRRTNRSSREARWRGNSGNQSVSVVLSGRKRGQWFDFSEQRGGRPIQAIQHFLGMSFMAALDDAADRIGYPRFDKKAVRKENAAKLAKERAERERKRAEREAEEACKEADQTAKAIRDASVYWNAGRNVIGTPGETYLRKTRGIDRDEPFAFPDSIRWNDAERALVFRVSNVDGAFVGVQTVAVTPDGKQDKLRHGAKIGAKKSRGPIGLGSIKFPSANDGPILFAEGPETGLSLWLATGHETRVVLGSSGFLRIIKEAPAGRKIILCRDDDPIEAPAYRAAVSALYKLGNAGFDVWDAWPFAERRQSKQDFNDAAIEQGLPAVAQRIEAAQYEQAPFRRIEHDISAAERVIDGKIADFFRRAVAHQDGETPPVMAMGVDTGGGKSHAAIKHLVQSVIKIRAAGDNRAIVFAVPEHGLSKEIEKRIRDELTKAGADYSVAIWRGREAKKPNASNDDDRMCDNLQTVREASDLHVKIEEEICKKCPHNPTKGGSCQYLLQKGLTADIWVAAHQIIFRKPPTAIAKNGGVAMLIIDESILDAGIADPFELPIDAIEAMALPFDEDDKFELLEYRHRLAEILRDAPEGFLAKAALSPAPGRAISYDMAAEAYRLEWSREVRPKHERDWRKRVANKSLTKATGLAKAITDLASKDGPAVSGHISVGKTPDFVRVVRVSRRLEIHEAWRVPTLLIDAMIFGVDALQHFWPSIEDMGRVNIATPHQRVSQVVNKSYAIGKLAPPKRHKKRKGVEVETEDGLEPDELAGLTFDARAKAAEKNRRSVEATIIRMARERGGRTLVVGNKAVIKAMNFPPAMNIETAWFAAVAGKDRWGDVRTLIVLGRPLPPPRAMEQRAATLTGQGVEALQLIEGQRRSGWYRRERHFRLQRRGKDIVKVPCEVDAHPDAMVEQLVWQKCVGQLMQAIGRGRGTRRTAANPLDVVVMTNTVLPIPIDDFLLAEDIEPSLDDLQIAAGGVAFDGGEAAAGAYPGLWPSAEAFRMAKAREKDALNVNSRFQDQCVTNPYKYIYTGLLRTGRETARLQITFQIAGERRRPQSAFYDPALCPDPKAFIEEKLGALAWISVESPDIPEDGEQSSEPLAKAVGAEELSAPRQPAPKAGPFFEPGIPPPANDAEKPPDWPS